MRYSFQLYSARNLGSIPDFLPRLAELGYDEVEGFGGLYEDAEGLAGALKANGLSMPTGHFGLDLLADRDRTLKIAETLGVRTLICPFIPPAQRPADKAGWQTLAKTLSRLGETYGHEGYSFAWHNHDFEFKPTADGDLPLELLLEEAGNISWQCDVAWVARGGGDPLAWLDRYKTRVVSIHVKDIAPQGENGGEDGWADVGQGVLEWPGLLAFVKSRTQCRSFVLEHDKPSDVDRFAARSIGYLQTLGRA